MTEHAVNPALHALNTRRSMKLLRAPAPKPDELAQILQAAMSAPDHGALRPWRFVKIQARQLAALPMWRSTPSSAAVTRA